MKIQAALIRRRRDRPRFARTRPNRKREARPVPPGVPALCAILAGLCCGVLLEALFPSGLASGLAENLTAFFGASDASFGAVLRRCLLPSAGLGLLIVYLGASPVGSPAIAALLCMRGCGLGAVAAFLAQRGTTGLSCYFALLFPAKALQLSGLFLVARRAMQLSKYYKSCLKRDSVQPEPVARRYLISCLQGLLLLVLSAAADTLLYLKVSPSFSSLAG